MIITRAMITNVAAILAHFTQSDCDVLFAELEPEARDRIGIGEASGGLPWLDTESGDNEIEEARTEIATLKTIVRASKAALRKAADEKRELQRQIDVMIMDAAGEDL